MEQSIGSRIVVIRGQRVILDSDLAKLYGVSTTRLNQQVTRNRERFPEDFMFEISLQELEPLMLHFATSITEFGTVMALLVVSAAFGKVGVASAPVCLSFEKKSIRDGSIYFNQETNLPLSIRFYFILRTLP